VQAKKRSASVGFADLPLNVRRICLTAAQLERFERQVTVGYMYMLKLNHLVDDKDACRSTGPYSLVTQQPRRRQGPVCRPALRRDGKSGPWSLRRAYTLPGDATVKSDDVNGRRTKMYKNIVDGNHRWMPECGSLQPYS